MEKEEEMNQTMDKFFTDLQDMWGTKDGALYYDPFDSEPPQPQPLAQQPQPQPPSPPRLPTSTYLPPTNPYALKIWRQCNFHQKGERKGTIERGLLSWANKNEYRSVGNDGVPHIDWEMNGNKLCGTWSAFVLWFFCSCTKVVAQNKYSL
jgi:hypothetical protein